MLVWSGRLTPEDDADATRRWARQVCAPREPDLAALGGIWCLVRLDPEGRGIAASSPLSGRPVFWAFSGGALVLGDDVEEIARLQDLDREPELSTLAAFFALHQDPRPGRTFLRGLGMVPGGSLLRFGPEGAGEPVRFWTPDTSVERGRPPEEHRNRVRRALRDAVDARVRDDDRPTVVLSSGLDSNLVASVAARSERVAELRAVSWGLKAFPEADESRWIAALARECGYSWSLVEASDAWPLATGAEAFLPPRWGPLVGPYRLLQRRVEEHAAELAGRVLLTGQYGDTLYAGAELWWRDLILDGRLGEALRLGARGLVGGGSAVRGPSGWKTLALQLVPSLQLPLPPAAERFPWLTAQALEHLAPGGRPPRFSQVRLARLTSPWQELGQATRGVELRRLGLEARHPFRDPRVAEAVLRLPAHLLRRPGPTKPLSRAIARGLVPEAARTAGRRGSLLPLALAMLDTGANQVREILDAPGAEWDRWVRREWLEEAIRELRSARRDGFEWVLLWRCIAFELWRRTI